MTIKDSVREILRQQEVVIEQFYDDFLAAAPEAKRYFNQVDLKQQALLLTMALITIESHFTDDFPATAHYLRVLGTRHRDNGIPVGLFPRFGDCLVTVLARFHGSQWTSELAKDWNDAFDKTTQTMLEGYDREFVY